MARVEGIETGAGPGNVFRGGLRTRELTLIVLLAAVAVYANSVGNGFALDDVWIIARNRHVFAFRSWQEIWLGTYWPSNGVAAGLYRPLTIWLYMLEWRLGGGDPWVFHLSNVLLHGVASVLVFGLVLRLTGERVGAFVGALLFAVHPLHTEAVANAVGQAELLSGVGVLGACLLWVGRPEDAPVGHRRVAAVVGCFLAAMLSKEIAIVLPALLVLLDLATGRVGRSRRSVLRWLDRTGFALALMVVAAAVFLALRFIVLGSVAGNADTPAVQALNHAGPRLLTAFRAWPEYMRLLFFPLRLSPDYSPAVILPVTVPSPFAVLGGLLLIGTAALALLTPLRPAVGLAPAWFLVAVLPVSNLVVPVGVIVAERTLYLPSVALSLLVGYAWAPARTKLHALRQEHSPRAARFATAAAAGAVTLGIGLLAVRTVVRNPDWHDNNRLMGALLREFPMSYRAQWSAAASAATQRDTTAALRRWALAYRIWPQDFEMNTEYGMYLVNVGRYKEAIPLLEAANTRHPYPGRGEHYLSIAYLRTGDYRHALVSVQRAIAAYGHPDPGLLEIRGYALLGLGDLSGVTRTVHHELSLPGGRRWTAFVLLARAYAAVGHPPAADAALDSALAHAPDSASAHAVRSASRELGLRR